MSKLRCFGFVFHMLIETLKRYLIHLYSRRVNEVSPPTVKIAVLCLGCKDEFIEREKEDVKKYGRM